MAKRFTDTEKWKDEFFSDLSIEHKLFYLYLLDNCDCAGVWRVNFKLAEFMLGCKISRPGVLKAFNGRLTELNSDYWLINKFIKYQYPEGLSEDCKAHKGVLKVLRYHNLEFKSMDRVRIEYGYSMDRVQDKDKDKDKDKDMDMDKDMDKEIKKGEIKPVKTKRVNKSVKEIKPGLEVSILEALTPEDPEIRAWLKTGSKKLQEKLFNTYDHEYLSAVIEKAYYWQLENKKREAGSYLSSWVERDEGKKYKGNLNSRDYGLKNFFDSAIIAGGLTIPTQGKI